MVPLESQLAATEAYVTRLEKTWMTLKKDRRAPSAQFQAELTAMRAVLETLQKLHDTGTKP